MDMKEKPSDLFIADLIMLEKEGLETIFTPPFIFAIAIEIIFSTP
jgi:hypothetical protein